MIDPLLAAGLTGGVVGLVGVVLTSVAGRGCEVIRGVGSCGGIGLLALLVILVLEVLLGAILLKAWRLSDPASTSFLGVGLAAVFVLLFLLSSLESVWMFLVIPVLTVLTFVLSWWVTETFAETSRRRPASLSLTGPLLGPLGNQLGDLHGVERSSLAEVVVADEQRQATLVGDARVVPQPSDVRRVLAGRLQRGRDVAQLDPGSVGEDLARLGDRAATARTRR